MGLDTGSFSFVLDRSILIVGQVQLRGRYVDLSLRRPAVHGPHQLVCVQFVPALDGLSEHRELRSPVSAELRSHFHRGVFHLPLTEDQHLLTRAAGGYKQSRADRDSDIPFRLHLALLAQSARITPPPPPPC